MSAIQKALCSINEFLMEFRGKWEMEYRGVDSSVKSVSIMTPQEAQKIAGRNPKRVELWIHNAGDKDLFLAPYTGEVGPKIYSLRIAPNDTLIMNSHNYAHLYKQQVQGFWDADAAATSTAKITEFYLS